MLEHKSDAIAEQYKLFGNEKCSKRQYIEALNFYNKTLCYAESRELQAIAYGNRSAVYFCLGKFKECLENIQLAKAHDYPQDRIQKLLDREQKCKKHVNVQLKDEDNFHNFLKLSYEPHPKISFIVDCVEVRKTEEFGHGIYATEYMNAGDIIAIEPPVFSSLDAEKSAYVCCSYCFKANMLNLIPCLKSASLMFCSESCRDKAYETYPQMDVLSPKNKLNSEGFVKKVLVDIEHAFGGADKFEAFVEQHDIEEYLEKTLFDYDFTDSASFKKNQFLASLSLQIADTARGLTEKIFPDFKIACLSNPRMEKFMKHLVSALYSNMDYLNCWDIDYEVARLITFKRLINHACWPNAAFSFVRDKFLIYLVRPVNAGEQIFLNYIGNNVHHPRVNRLAILHQTHNFVCNCYLCETNHLPNHLPTIDYQLGFGYLGITLSQGFKYFKDIYKEKQSAERPKLLKLAKTFIEMLNENIYEYNERSQPVWDIEKLIETYFSTLCLLLEIPYTFKDSEPLIEIQ